MLSPAGSPVAAKLVGALLAVMRKPNAEPAFPLAVVPLFIMGALVPVGALP